MAKTMALQKQEGRSSKQRAGLVKAARVYTSTATSNVGRYRRVVDAYDPADGEMRFWVGWALRASKASIPSVTPAEAFRAAVMDYAATKPMRDTLAAAVLWDLGERPKFGELIPGALDTGSFDVLAGPNATDRFTNDCDQRQSTRYGQVTEARLFEVRAARRGTARLRDHHLAQAAKAAASYDNLRPELDHLEAMLDPCGGSRGE